MTRSAYFWLPLAAGGVVLAGLALASGGSAATTEDPVTAATDSAASADLDEAADGADSADDAGNSAASPAALAVFRYTGALTQGGYLRGKVPSGTIRASLGEQALDLAPDGSFFAAFDRDSSATLTLQAELESGETVSEALNVSARQWDIERVNVARRPGGASAAFMERRRPELSAIWDARQQETGSQGWQQNFIWPVEGRISGRFGRQRIYRGEPGSYHSGLDIAPGAGVPFVAPADGVVVLARSGFSLEGGLIIIDHGMGLNSAFLHASRIVVEEGQRVSQGDHIGNVGSTGRATGPHLHWSLKWKDARLDPLLFVGPMGE